MIDRSIKGEGEYMLSTLDNPYNPCTEFDKWYNYDERKGYHTCAYLARVLYTSDNISDEEQEEAYKLAVDEILRFNLTGNYVKAYENQVAEALAS